jgi:hypothetical protein
VSEDAKSLKARLKEAIVRYVCKYPSARDTERGILVSWLPSEGFEQAPHLIAEVLDEMVQEQSLEIDRPTGGDPLYSRGPIFPDRPRSETG